MCRVLIGYIDESGNTGDPMVGGSLTYALGCVLIDADLWPSAFDEMLEFRRRLKVTFGVPMRAEIKANYLLRNAGTLRAYRLGPSARYLIYRAHLRICLLYTSDAADEEDSVDLGGRRIIKKKK